MLNLTDIYRLSKFGELMSWFVLHVTGQRRIAPETDYVGGHLQTRLLQGNQIIVCCL